MSANEYVIIALTGRAHCKRQVAFFLIKIALRKKRKQKRLSWRVILKIGSRF